MITWRVYPYKKGSKSAKALAEALGGKRLRVEGSRWKPKAHTPSVVINWGSSAFEVDRYPTTILNYPENVEIAANKLSAFTELDRKGISVPQFTTDKAVSAKWIREQGSKVVCRQTLRGHSGEGIILAEKEEQLVDAPLYVEYIPKIYEFRVHVFQGKSFFVQRKARNRDIPDEQVNWQVRNHQNGFIYAYKDIEVPDEVVGEGEKAVLALGLDFGAADIIWSKKYGVFVLEVNTACGLEGTTLEKYKEVFQEAFP